jgi:soluble lytic murein transglycosylase
MKKILFYSLFLNLLFFSFCSANGNIWLQQRWQFQETQKFLSSMDKNSFEQVMAGMNNYPIAHYLRYFYFRKHLDDENPAVVKAFLKQYQGSPVAKSLRRLWLGKLAKQADWKTFIAVYTPQKGTVLRCYNIQAHLKTRGTLTTNLITEAKNLWTVGKSQPDVCDPAFAYLYKNGLVTTKMRWQRIRLSMKKGKLGLARYLSKSLSQTDRQLVAFWQKLYKNPATELNNFKQPDSELSREILLQSLRRLARKDAGNAYNYWQYYKNRYTFSQEEQGELFRYIAIRATWQNLPQADNWLAKVDKDFVDDRVKQTRLQNALAQQNWQAVIAVVKSLPLATQEELKWQYWYARALEKTGRIRKAKQIFQALSKHRNFYGFLAADKLRKPYQFEERPLKITKAQKNKLLKKYAGLIRARELYLVGIKGFARIEWAKAIADFKTEEFKIAASIAHDWAWHDRAIITIAKAKDFDDIKLRFSLPFYDSVLSNAKAKNLEYAFAYAIMRQESAFQEDVRSSAGALGLMQLMPGTARLIARKEKMPSLKNINNLLVPDINIKFGTSYLRYLLDKFNGNYLLATAGYNAGPGRSTRWAKKYGCLPQDIWVELIPFRETRKYVQRVLHYMPIFEKNMGVKVKPMRMDKIQVESCF